MCPSTEFDQIVLIWVCHSFKNCIQNLCQHCSNKSKEFIPLPFNLASLDSVIIQNTRAMGQKAVEEIDAIRRGQPVPATLELEPKLVTRENINSPEVQQWTSMDWRAVPWNWSTTH